MRPTARRRAGFARGAGLAMILLATLVTTSYDFAQAQGGRDCFQDLLDGRGREIVCPFPTRLTEREKADLKAATRDVLLDVTCTVAVRIERRLVVEAVKATGRHVFQAPPQPMTCEIVTKDGRQPVKGTFAPRIEFEGGRAIAGTPGLAAIEGVPALLAAPVVAYVNNSATTRDAMLAIINTLKQRYGTRVAG